MGTGRAQNVPAGRQQQHNTRQDGARACPSTVPCLPAFDTYRHHGFGLREERISGSGRWRRTLLARFKIIPTL